MENTCIKHIRVRGLRAFCILPNMPSKKHLPPTGELIYKKVGKKERYKLVTVPKAATASTAQTTDTTAPCPAPTIAPPSADAFTDNQNAGSWQENEELSAPKRSGKVGLVIALLIII